MAIIKWRQNILPADPLSINELVRSTGVFSEEEVQCAGDMVAESLGTVEGTNYHFLFAELAGKIIGYTCFGRIPFTDQRYDLYWIAVHPDHQKLGLAADLLRRTELQIQELNGKHVYIETSTRDIYTPARKFYGRNGYEEIAVLKDFYSDGDGKFMVRKLLD